MNTMARLITPVAVLYLLALCKAAPQTTDFSLMKVKARQHLAQFGYLPRLQGDERVELSSVFTDAVTHFQDMARLPKTGILDEATVAMMQKPRCGVKDLRAVRRGKRYAHAGTHWSKPVLTWRLSRSSSSLPDLAVLHTLQMAFNIWSSATNLKFAHKSRGPVDIEIFFTLGDHQDGYPFDGRGGVLAHAFPPPKGAADDSLLSGDIHFDDAERWTASMPSEGYDIMVTALHEIGHSLGLEHSQQKGSVMWPWSQSEVTTTSLPQLAYDDILAIQLLYGGKQKRVQRDSSSQFFCLQNTDAIFRGADNRIYHFNGDQVTELDPATLSAAGETQSIHSVFTTFPEEKTVDAAVTFKGRFAETKSYLFKGDKYYRFSSKGNRLIADAGYPKLISVGWSMNETNFDTVFNYKNKNTLMFVKGNQYWLHTGSNHGPYPGFPISLSDHAHQPICDLNGLNAAYLHEFGTNYMFSDGHVYKLTWSAHSGEPSSQLLC